ncbi:MAG: hypothetical protein JO189_24550 [Deltaproteobacteria bacterium]|nr:hypothetical protein [Deltaproteobacteria bacterium]
MEQIGYALDPSVVAVILAILMIGAWRIGIRLGRSLRAGNRATSQFDGAAMALLGLLLAFAFGTSMGKYEQRRIALIEDSNAIGDFYTCATLLKEPTRSKLQAVIRSYAEQRLEVARQPLNSLNLESALTDFQRMHQQMTTLVDQALSGGTPIAVSLTNTLNAVTSNHTARLAAIRDRLPGSVVALLFVAAIVTATLIGRNQGFSGGFDPGGTLCFVLIVSLAVYVTLDLNLPERGFIRVSQEPIERLISSMQG